MGTYEEFTRRPRDYDAEIYDVFGADGDRVKEAIQATDPLVYADDIDEYIADSIPDALQHMQPAEHKDLADAFISFHEQLMQEIETADDPNYGGILSQSLRQERQIIARALEIIHEKRERSKETSRPSTPTAISRAIRDAALHRLYRSPRGH